MRNRNNLFFRKPFKYSFSRVTLFLIIVNCIVFGISYLIPRAYEYIRYYGALNVILVDKGHMFWQFFTYMFVHSNVSHLFFNMLALLIFGFNVERTIGSKEFLLFYIVCGTVSGVFSYFVYKFTGQYLVFLMGASGAIYSLLFAYAVLYPRSMVYVWGVIPIPSPLLVLLYTGIEIFSQMRGKDGVAHLTHLFGFAAAWLYFMIRMGINPIKVWKNTYVK